MVNKSPKPPIKAQIGYLFFPDGRTIRVRPANNRRFMLQEFQKAIGGYVERVRPRQELKYTELIVNEEGQRLDLPLNKHSQSVVDIEFYGYGSNWKAYGIIFGIKTDVFDPQLPTVTQVMRKESIHASKQ